MLKCMHSLLLLPWLCFAAAPEQPHWAYQPLARPEIPQSGKATGTRTPIDQFIAASLKTNQLSLAPEADKRTLLRRIYFDLVGLPPTPDDVHGFLNDRSTNAYERVVDRLLASPRYGERWARHWMDAIHFAETHGHDQDRIRTNAWPYRDYLIQAFNGDKPYARFVEEQVAGDVLFPDEPQSAVALGFLAAGPWDESSLRDIREETTDRQIARYLDRDDMLTTVMQTFSSTTVQCARCHDHKFDPVPQKDYYALQAVFAGVDRANRRYDADASVHKKRAALLREKERADHDRSWLLSEPIQREANEFSRLHTEEEQHWKVIAPETFVSTGGATLTRKPDGSVLASGVRPERDTYTFTAKSPLPTVTAVRLEVLTDDTLPMRGPGRQGNGNFHLSEFQLLVFSPERNVAREISISHASSDFDQAGWTIQHALDRQEKTAWGIFPKTGEVHQAVFQLKEPLLLAAGSTLSFVLKQLHGDGHLIGRARFSVSSSPSPTTVTALPASIEKILSRNERSEDEKAALAAFVVRQRIARDLAALPKPSLVYAAASDFEPDGSLKPSGKPRPVHMLKRGDINKPLSAASPGALSCVTALPSTFESNLGNEGSRRAALARWLADRDNMLTWRSIVNRVWHHHFGRGLVETPNDFGRMGSAPSHPELLDWLAVWFRDDAQGSLKALHRLIVTSATYRQAAVAANSPAQKITKAAPDAENRLLSHMNRTRLDADQVRDAILQISGALDLRMGGPSDMQFDLQPGHHVTPKVDYTKFDLSQPQASRRSIYRFLFRTLPDPFMDALDCPAGDQLTPVRNASVTVQQALAMWNDAFVIHHAERFAQRLELSGKTTSERVRLACEFTLNRAPTETELNEFQTYVGQHGLANFCRLLFNSNEFMFVN